MSNLAVSVAIGVYEYEEMKHGKELALKVDFSIKNDKICMKIMLHLVTPTYLTMCVCMCACAACV